MSEGSVGSSCGCRSSRVSEPDQRYGAPVSGWIVGGSTVCRPGPIRSTTRLPAMFQLCDCVMPTVVEQRLAARAGLAHVRRRQDVLQSCLDRRIFAVDVDRDQAMTGLTGNDADTGVARGPALALGRRRRTAVEASLPVGKADPYAGEQETRPLGPRHYRHGGEAALYQPFGTLRIGTHHAIRGSKTVARC